MAGMNQSAVRRVNTSVILRTLAVSAGPMTLAELSERVGLSRRTVELILDSLVDAGRVSELERVPVSGCAGRPARRYELRAEHALLAAVRFTTLGRGRGRRRRPRPVLGRAHRPLRAYQDPQATLDDMAALVREALADAGGSADQLRAGAIASGGAIDDDGVIRRLVHTTQWEGVCLPEELDAAYAACPGSRTTTPISVRSASVGGARPATTTTSYGRCSGTGPASASSSGVTSTAVSTAPRARSPRRPRYRPARSRTAPWPGSPHRNRPGARSRSAGSRRPARVTPPRSPRSTSWWRTSRRSSRPCRGPSRRPSSCSAAVWRTPPTCCCPAYGRRCAVPAPRPSNCVPRSWAATPPSSAPSSWPSTGWTPSCSARSSHRV